MGTQSAVTTPTGAPGERRHHRVGLAAAAPRSRRRATTRAAVHLTRPPEAGRRLAPAHAEAVRDAARGEQRVTRRGAHARRLALAERASSAREVGGQRRLEAQPLRRCAGESKPSTAAWSAGRAELGTARAARP